uniref:Uncharacterized protein n=1 Tax=Phlebotomus papatasi TaxID=29031 RepID=A0A1B0DK26_PHLPP
MQSWKLLLKITSATTTPFKSHCLIKYITSVRSIS